MSVSAFPLEVLENIFIYLDGCSFCKCRQVCKAWNATIKDMQQKQSVWKEFCLRDIPRNVLEEMVWFKSVIWSDVDWRSVYKRWYRSRMMLTSPYWKRKIYSDDKNPVTCIRLSGSWIITGHSNGSICVWNSENGDLTQNFLCHLKVINDIALVDLLNLGFYYGSEALPWAHHHMITISKDRYINVVLLLEPMVSSDSHIHINFHTDDLKQIRIFGDIFAVNCQDNTISLWKMKVVRKPHFSLDIALLQKIVGPLDFILSLGLWHDEVQCVSNSGKLKTIVIHEDEWVLERCLNLNPEGCEDTLVAVTAAYVLRKKTAIILTSDGKIIISVHEDYNKYYYLMNTLQTTVVSLAFYGPILALGGENGKLFLFHVPCEKHLLSLDLSQPHLTLSLSEASIIAIDISYQEDSPIVAASTNDCLYIVKWFQSHQVVKKRDVSQLFT